DAVLHAIDIEGVRVQNDMAGGRITSDDGLFLLARPTGGEVFHNSNDLGRDFRKMLHQQEVVYVIAFQAPASKSGRFHNLDVRLAGVPGARASYRSGYYESGGGAPIQRTRSEEHTSELQSHLKLVCRPLLEKKKIRQGLSR